MDLYRYQNLKGANRPLYEDMRKYGINSFSFEIIESCQADEANKREEFWIEEISKHNSIYNKEKRAKRKNQNTSTKRKIAMAQTGNKNHMYGKKGVLCKNSKRVIDITTGQIFNSMRECALAE